MEISEAQINHFNVHGFFFIPNPFGEDGMRELERIAHEIHEEWKETEWPKEFNRLACQFLMLGEPILRFVEQPEFVEAGRKILGCDEIHVGACGHGDALSVIAEDDRAVPQVQWHVDGGPDVKTVAFRTAFDRHDPTNAPLRVLPGSHLRDRAEVQEELTQLELATGQYNSPPEMHFAKHPHEVEVILDPRMTLVWTPSTWHATGVKTAAGPRRAFGWNYSPKGGRKRDTETVKYMFNKELEGWTDERKRLWGIEE